MLKFNYVDLFLRFIQVLLRRVGLVVNMSASHAVGRRFAPLPGHAKDNHINGTNCLLAWHTCARVGI